MMSFAVKNLESEHVELMFKPYEEFCRAMLDAYVLVNNQGRIIKFNQLMCQLTSLKSKQLLKAESLEEVITFKVNGQKLPISTILNQSSPTRIDEVRGSVPGNDNLNLILGIYPFHNESNELVGSFVLIRDVTAETNLQGKFKDAQHKSISDPLTGLFTRGYFEDYLRSQGAILPDAPVGSDHRNMSIVMLDIDFFKKVNDVYGHQAGDHILKTVSHLVRKGFRKSDVVCRYGGEEFIAILPNTDLQGAVTASEKIRASVEAEIIKFDNVHIPVTISIGVAQIKVGEETPTETIARADQALYEAKHAGRNRVKIANN